MIIHYSGKKKKTSKAHCLCIKLEYRQAITRKNEKYNMNRTTTWIRLQPEINYATPNQIIDQAPKRDSPCATKGPVLDGVFHILHRDNLPNIKNNSSNHLFFSTIIVIYILLCRISN